MYRFGTKKNRQRSVHLVHRMDARSSEAMKLSMWGNIAIISSRNPSASASCRRAYGREPS